MRLVLFICALLLGAEDTAPPPRITFDVRPTVVAGDTVQSAVVFLGTREPSRPYPGHLISGHLNQRSAADSLLYIFLLADARDSTRVSDLVSAYPPSAWKALKAKSNPHADLLARGSFLAVPVNADGVFIFVVDNYRHPGKKVLIAVDASGRIAAKRRIWEE